MGWEIEYSRGLLNNKDGMLKLKTDHGYVRSALVNGPISRQNYQLCYFYFSFNNGCMIIFH